MSTTLCSADGRRAEGPRPPQGWLAASQAHLHRRCEGRGPHGQARPNEAAFLRLGAHERGICRKDLLVAGEARRRIGAGAKPDDDGASARPCGRQSLAPPVGHEAAVVPLEAADRGPRADGPIRERASWFFLLARTLPPHCAMKLSNANVRSRRSHDRPTHRLRSDPHSTNDYIVLKCRLDRRTIHSASAVAAIAARTMNAVWYPKAWAT